MKVFYHSGDLDGRCSGAILMRAFKLKEEDMFGIDYGQDFPWEVIKLDEPVFMVDYTLQPYENMYKLNEKCELIWIDHHKNAIDFLDDSKEINIKAEGKDLKCKTSSLIKGSRRVDMSACELAWLWCYDGKVNKMPETVKLLGKYDIWELDYSDKLLPFQYGMRTLNTDISHSIWDALFKIDFDISEIVERGEIALSFCEQEYQEYMNKHFFELEFEGLRAICCNRGRTGKMLFDSMWDENKYDIMFNYVRLPNRIWSVHLYSTKDNIDCSKIANKYGGGGHPGASGFQCKELPFEI